jgi:hypothetical protein
MGRLGIRSNISQGKVLSMNTTQQDPRPNL